MGWEKSFFQDIYTVVFFLCHLRAYHFMQTTTIYQFTSVVLRPFWLVLDVAWEVEFFQ